MTKLRTLVVAGSTLAVLALTPALSFGDSYKTDDSDHVWRYMAYPAHAVGKGVEYLVTRPIHWIVSRPKMRYVFGHTSKPKSEDYCGDADLYQRYSY